MADELTALGDWISSVSEGSYQKAPDYDRPEILAWATGLRDMSDEDFITECANRILDSAIMNGSRLNGWGAHARADICADEADRRHREAGHTLDCRGETLYGRGHRRALQSQGHKPQPPASCTCTKRER